MKKTIIPNLKKDESNRVPLRASIEPRLDSWLRDTARENGCSMSTIVEAAVSMYMRTHDPTNPLASEIMKCEMAEARAGRTKNKGVRVKHAADGSIETRLCPRGYAKCYVGGCSDYDTCESPIRVQTEEVENE